MNNLVRLKTLAELRTEGIETHINSNGCVVLNTANRSNVILPRYYTILIETSRVPEGEELSKVCNLDSLALAYPELITNVRIDRLDLI
jgi:hypothetical protein